MNKTVLSFRCTHDAIASQHRLTTGTIPFQVIPTPTEITSDCGIALLVDAGETDQALGLLAPLEITLTAATFVKGRLIVSREYVPRAMSLEV